MLAPLLPQGVCASAANIRVDQLLAPPDLRLMNVIVLIGAGSIGLAIARRVSAGKHVLLADLRQQNAEVAS